MIANHDFPYHDEGKFLIGDIGFKYVVGANNVDAHGSQRKHFVSKSTLFYCTAAAQVRFNHSDNVVIDIPANVLITFLSNIREIFIVTVADQVTLYAWFEGVLPQQDVLWPE